MAMDATDHFAQQANLFEIWILQSSTQGGQFAREAVQHLMQLYLAALELPAPWSDGLANAPETPRIGDEEQHRVLHALGVRLPFDAYGIVFDPLILPPEECSIGSLADDLLDIYRDVVTGLREYERGRRANALWEWGLSFQQHWGYHATAAIRSLHNWLASEELDRLSQSSKSE